MLIVPVVEGHGEVQAVPLLLRRWSEMHAPGLRVYRAIRAPGRGGLLRAGGIERFVQVAAGVPDVSGILVFIDSEGDCPAELGPSLSERATNRVSHIPCAVVVAHRMYENWFLGSIETIRGQRGWPENLEPVEGPEAVKNAKRWLTEHRQGRWPYRETLDQPALTARLDFGRTAERCDSFAKFLRCLDELRQPPGSRECPDVSADP